MNTEKNDELFRTFMDLTKQMQRYGFATRGQQHGRHHGFGRGRLLQLISDHDNVTQSELAELLDIRPSSLSEMLSKLSDGGLIERHADENDKRITHVVLTETGRKRLAERKQTTDEYLTGLFDGLTDEETQQLQQLLAKLDGSLKDKLADMDDAPEPEFGSFAGPAGHLGRRSFNDRNGFDPRGQGFNRQHHDNSDMGMMNGFWR